MKRFASSGYGMAIFAALGFSIKSILVKLIFEYGVDPMTLLLMRMYVALPFFILALLWWEGPSALRVKPGELLRYTIMGVMGAGGAMYFSFVSLSHLSASLGTLVVYIYPSLTILLGFALHRHIKWAQIPAVVITFLGLALVVRIDLFGGSDISLIGVLTGLVAASCFALYNVMGEGLLKIESPIKVAAYCMTILTMVLGALFGVRSYPLTPEVWGLAALLGIFSGFIPFIMFLYGIKKIGAGKAAVVNSLGPVFNLIWAYLFFGEVLDGVQWTGVGAVVLGIVALKLRSPAGGGGDFFGRLRENLFRANFDQNLKKLLAFLSLPGIRK